MRYQGVSLLQPACVLCGVAAAQAYWHDVHSCPGHDEYSVAPVL